MTRARSVYDIEGACDGKRLWLIAPGPSSEPWTPDRFAPISMSDDDVVLAVNAAIEFTSCDFWFWSDKRIGWIYGHNIHGQDYCPPVMVCPSHQTKMEERFVGDHLFFYDYQMQLKAWEGIVGKGRVEGKPFWYSPTRRYLPGRASVVNNAISFAWLLHPRVCILVGVDWCEHGGSYYRSGVLKNAGPTDRGRALAAGEKWFRMAMEMSLWDGMRIVKVEGSTCPGVESMRWEDACRA